MHPLEKLAELFALFPGIGVRQSKRFAYFIAEQNDSFIRELGMAITTIRASMKHCVFCRRLAVLRDGTTHCGMCADTNRDSGLLILVEKDSDLDAIERAGTYRGHYFVLGGLLSEDGKKTSASVSEFLTETSRRASQGLTEIIIAFSAKPEADYTFFKLKEKIASLPCGAALAVSRLGRGISTGTEIEYSDADTLINALANRK